MYKHILNNTITAVHRTTSPGIEFNFFLEGSLPTNIYEWRGFEIFGRDKKHFRHFTIFNSILRNSSILRKLSKFETFRDKLSKYKLLPLLLFFKLVIFLHKYAIICLKSAMSVIFHE